jgi:hypothetical protein
MVYMSGIVSVALRRRIFCSEDWWGSNGLIQDLCWDQLVVGLFLCCLSLGLERFSLGSAVRMVVLVLVKDR